MKKMILGMIMCVLIAGGASAQLINTWHIPGNYEACNTSTPMRDPLNPSDPSAGVWIHTGVWPIGGADTVTVCYRVSTAGAWDTTGCGWECNYNNNDYWGEDIPGDTGTWGDTIQYYIKVTKSGSTDTYIYDDGGSSATTDTESVAQGSPFTFAFPAPTDTPEPTVTPAVTDTPTAMPTDTPTPAATDTPTAIPTDTPTPTVTPTATATHVPGSGTYHTIITDGVNDFDDPEEHLGDCGDDSFWLTWDAHRIYLGFMHFDYHFCDFSVYFDTDGTAGGSAVSENINGGTHAFPDTFRPEYHLYVDDYDDPQYFAVRTWNGSSWQDNGNQWGIAASFFKYDGITEIAIDRSTLGDPEILKVLCFEMQETASTIFCAFPEGNPTGTGVTFTHYYLFDDLGTGIVPGDTGYVITASARLHAVINEFMWDPGADWNQDGTASDATDEYIELYLPAGYGNADIGECFLDDIDGGGSSPYGIEVGTRMVAGAIRVFFSGDTDPSVVQNAYPHGTGIALNNSGTDWARYLDVDATELDARSYSGFSGDTDYVYRRCPDGGVWDGPSADASPGQANGCTGPTATPTATATPTPDYTATPTPVFTSTPTATPGNPMNLWHIPRNEEPPTVTMRNPLYVTKDDTTVYIYCGGYPIGTIWGSGSSSLAFRKTGEISWHSADFNWDSNQGVNEYFMASIDLSGYGYVEGDTIEYYLSMNGDPSVYDTTYVYGTDDACSVTLDESIARAAPFTFTILGALPSSNMLGIFLMLAGLSAAFFVTFRR